jgi:hypothetical protein
MPSFGARTGLPYVMGMAKETVLGTYVAPTCYLKYVTGPWDEGIAEQTIPTHDGTRSPGLMIRTEAVPQMPLAIPAWPENGLEQLLYGALGNKNAPVPNGSSPIAYSHVMPVTQGNPATSLPSWSFTEWANGIATEAAMVHTGCMINDLQLAATGPGVVNLAATIVGNPLDLSHTAPTQTYAASNPFTFDQLTTLVDAVSMKLTSFNLEVNNNIGAGLNLADGTLLNTLRAPGELDISGQLAYPFMDQGDLMKYLGGTGSSTAITNIILDHALTVNFTGPVINGANTYLLSFVFPRIKLTKPTINFDDSGNPITYGFTWTALPATNGTLVTATVQSKLAAIT